MQISKEIQGFQFDFLKARNISKIFSQKNPSNRENWDTLIVYFSSDKVDQNTNFAKFPSAKWLFLNKLTLYLQFLNFWLNLFFVLDSLVWENLRGNLKHKILALVDPPLLLVQPEVEVGP